jgi:hypothetical protein
MIAFDPERIIRLLLRHKVDFVLVGGFAATLHGSTTVTSDLDICYSREAANLERLAAALRELDVRLRGAPDDLPFKLDARSLRNGLNFTFRTVHGNFDCLGDPGGGVDYASLSANADSLDIDGININVASLDDLIRMKRAAGRSKDLIEVENLSKLREVRDELGKDAALSRPPAVARARARAPRPRRARRR